MSSLYESSDPDQSNEDRDLELFTLDYLTNYKHVILQWQQNYLQAQKAQTNQQLKYLRNEIKVLEHFEFLLLSAYQIRAIAFVFKLKDALECLFNKYINLFKIKKSGCKVEQQECSQKLDLQTIELTHYLQFVQQTNMMNFAEEMNSDIHKQHYKLLKNILLYALSPQAIWRIMMLTENYQQEEKICNMNISLTDQNFYYIKQVRDLIRKNAVLNQFHQNYRQIQNGCAIDIINLIQNITSLDIESHLQERYIQIMKGWNYLNEKTSNNNIQKQYSLAILYFFYHRSIGREINYKYYEQLFITIFKQALKNPKVFELSLYVQPDIIPYQKRKQSVLLEEMALDMLKKIVQSKQKYYQNHNNHKQSQSVSLDVLLSAEWYSQKNFMLLVYMLIAIQENGRQALTYGDYRVHLIYLQIARYLRSMYLSFKDSCWIIPSTIFIPLQIKFFNKIGQDIKPDIKTVMYEMATKLNTNFLQTKIIYQSGQLKQVAVTRLEYLSAILYYLQDYNKQQQYVNLPDIIPNNLESALLLIKSMKLKLKYHEPNENQKPQYCKLLDQCSKMSLIINFKWYQRPYNIIDRQKQFAIQRQLHVLWMRQLYCRCLNLRDKEAVQHLIPTNSKKKYSFIVDIANSLKFNRSYEIQFPNPRNLSQQDTFSLLEVIGLILNLKIDIFNMSFEEEISFNYLHICLGFYNFKVKQAEGSQIYLLILHKIMLPYIKTHINQSNLFKKQFPNFFKPWIYAHNITQLGFYLINHISQFEMQEDYCNDIIQKIRLFRQNYIQFCKQTNQKEKIVQWLCSFISIFHRNMDPDIYIEGLNLILCALHDCSFLKHQICISLMVNESILSKNSIYNRIFKQSKDMNCKAKRFLHCHLSKKIPQIISIIGLNAAFQLIKQQINYQKQNSEQSSVISLISESIFKAELSSLQIGLLKLIFSIHYKNQYKNSFVELFNQNQAQIQENYGLDLNIVVKYLQLHMKQLQKSPLNGIIFSKLPFLQEIKLQLQLKDKLSDGQKIHQSIWLTMLHLSDNNQNLFDFCNITKRFNFILDRQLHRENLFFDLLQYYNRDIHSQIFKQILNSEKISLSSIQSTVSKLIKHLQCQNQITKVYHINRLIQINNKMPNKEVEAFILKNIGKQSNSSGVKIVQNFLVVQIKKLLEKIPSNIGQHLLLKKHSTNQLVKMEQDVELIFQKILYLSIKKFQNVKLGENQLIETGPQGEEWKTQSEGSLDQSEKYEDKSQEEGIHTDSNIESSNESESSQLQDRDRPQFLEIFTNEDKTKLSKYKQFIIVRQLVDVRLMSNYDKLIDPQMINDKQLQRWINQLIERLTEMPKDYAQLIVDRMPEQLYLELKKNGLLCDRNFKQILKVRQPTKSKPQFLFDDFSDREQSDDSESTDRNAEDYDDENEDDEDEDDNEDEDIQSQNQQSQKSGNNRILNNDQIRESDNLPELIPTMSKIQDQIKGKELNQIQITKILEIAAYKLLTLPNWQIKTKHISSFYCQIFQCDFRKIFVESVIILLRFEEQEYGEQLLERKKSSRKNQIKQITGLQEIIFDVGLQNLLDLLILSGQKLKDNNILMGQSQALLPVAAQFIGQIDLPIQSNIISLLKLYICSKKQRIRDKIKQLKFEIFDKNKRIKLKTSQLTKIMKLMLKHQCNHSNFWLFTTKTIGIDVNNINKLISCIDIYGRQMYEKIQQIYSQITKLFQKQNNKPNLQSLQHSYYVIGNIIACYQKDIKRFYFANKNIVKDIFENNQNDGIKGTPKSIMKHKYRILNNQTLIKLTQSSFFLLKVLRNNFEGRIQDKHFKKLLKYPKQLINNSFMYIRFLTHSKNLNWYGLNKVENFFQHYQPAQYIFSSLKEVSNLILPFLNMQSFCSKKFKHIIMPYLIDNLPIARQVPLIFKTPGVQEQIDGQTVLVTRQCSFDMTFYQMTHANQLLVQFVDEDGSDQGGMIRELMIGWTGHGIGEEDFFIGKLLGISFRQGVPYGGYLDLAMCIALTSFTPTLEFYQQNQRQIYQSLTYIRDNDPQDLCLNFTIFKDIYGQRTHFKLNNYGNILPLTQKNKHEYIQLYLQKYFSLGRQFELSELRTGFLTIVNGKYASLFSPKQIMKQLRGQQIVDYRKLKVKTKYQEGYTEQSPIIEWFWQILADFNREKMNKFVQFLTGSPKMSIFNHSFEMSIEKVFDIQRLPVAHTCFNTLDLPEYNSKQILYSKLITAIFDGNENFGIL